MNTQKMPLKNSLCLLLAATIWGIAFVAQSVGMEYVGPFTFNGVRSLIGAAVLVPVIFLLNRSKDTASAAADPSTSTTTSSPYKTRDLWIGGIACGIALFDKRLVYKRIGRHWLSVQLLADKHKLCLLYISVIVRCSACKVGLCKLILISARMRAEIAQCFPVSVGEE